MVGRRGGQIDGPRENRYGCVGVAYLHPFHGPSSPDTCEGALHRFPSAISPLAPGCVRENLRREAYVVLQKLRRHPVPRK
eukprot:CAMPEP_0194297398 /NCGR_PEP_ID=MMETSP0169-20130528/58772_1 /TAXON_ID=218684 /ORGANISM="Corethron pennatum, Strain L29A3" /LENGTH=79 /DNA_ID=CAMNT_0039047187 /DNA_START=593 /DNA_END=832 /DNA_ORIENTATION=+